MSRSCAYLVFTSADGRAHGQRVRPGTQVADLEDLWQAAWEDTAPTKSERIRVGLAWRAGLPAKWSVSSWSDYCGDPTETPTQWLGLRDAVLPSLPDDDDQDIAEADDGEQGRDVAEQVEEEADGRLVDEGGSDGISLQWMHDRATEAREAHKVATELDGKIKRTKASARRTAVEAKEARIKVGKILVEVREQHGGPERGPNAKWWGDFLRRCSIPRSTARRYMRSVEVSTTGRNQSHLRAASVRGGIMEETRTFARRVHAMLCEPHDAGFGLVVAAELRALADEVETATADLSRFGVITPTIAALKAGAA